MKTLQDLMVMETLVGGLLTNGGMGVYPTPVSNGADFYTCPACGAHKNVKGHIGGGLGDLSQVDHKAGCSLMELQKLIKGV